MKDGHEDSECSAFEVHSKPSQENWITSRRAADLEYNNMSLKEMCFDGMD
jgi:hypothetical protein